jgi:hypothetical protein
MITIVIILIVVVAVVAHVRTIRALRPPPHVTTITRNHTVPRGIWRHKNLFQVVVVRIIGCTLGNNKKKESTAVVVVPSVLQLQIAIVLAR